MSRVEFNNVEKRFDGTTVLSGISFAAEQGEFVVLLGPSGCGKSTSLRLLAGLERPDKGEIRIADTVVNRIPPSERGLAMVFQNYALFPHLTVRENILFGLKVRRIPRQKRHERLQRAASLLGLDQLLVRKPAQLSGGQRQRVALGRALVNGASVVLMDEPLSNLDAKLRQQMRLEIRELQKELGLTVVYVTHDQVEAMTMADRVVVMRDGHIDQIAPPRELYRYPARTEVARFIGAPPMCLLEASARSGEVAIHGTDMTLLVDCKVPERLLIGLRAEDLTLEPSSEMFALQVCVEGSELLGADVLVWMNAGASESLVGRFPTDADLPPGQRVTVGISADRLHVFDADTRERVSLPGGSLRGRCRDRYSGEGDDSGPVRGAI